MGRYWRQGGRITVGFLGAAQLDRFGNINTTIIGDYDNPKVRLPGGGGAPEIASSCGEIYITMAQSTSPMSTGSRLASFPSLGGPSDSPPPLAGRAPRPGHVYRCRQGRAK